MSWIRRGGILRIVILAGIGVPGLRTMAASARPKLTPSLDAKTFGKWYWEVKELVAFLREQGLSSTGLKADLTKRVREFLSTGDVAERRAAPGKGPRDSAIPGGLKLSTPVKNYNNDAATRSFFEKHLDGFRFNEYLRGFAKGISGQKITYGDLVEGWKKAEKKRSEGKQEIGKQFEYNQFTRDFFAANSGGSRKEMMEAWRTIRNCEGPNTYKEFARRNKRKRS